MYAISVQHLEKTYKNDVSALKGIDLNVEEGDFFALLGPNGAGKTTLIGIISSLVNKTKGKILVFDKDLDLEPELVKSYIGVVPQEFNFTIFEKVQDIVANQGGYYGLSRKLALQRTEIYLKKLDLWDKRNQQARMLSGGMKRRLMIARALVHEPRLLILDEPTAGVDIEIRRSLWQFLRELNESGITIILTTHYLEEAENLCRNIAIIDKGQIIENTKMSTLLSQLKGETILLYLQSPLSELPQLGNYKIRLIDEQTLEVDLTPQQNLNELFAKLTQKSLQIVGMKNKSNRLEELFLRIIAERDDKHGL